MATDPIGDRLFIDGVKRPVYLDDDGRQFVMESNGLRVHGVWLVPEPDDADAPIVAAEK